MTAHDVPFLWCILQAALLSTLGVVAARPTRIGKWPGGIWTWPRTATCSSRGERTG